MTWRSAIPCILLLFGMSSPSAILAAPSGNSRQATEKQPPLLAEFRQGPMASVEAIVFAVRQPGKDGHWYANFSYYIEGTELTTYGKGGRLCRLNLADRKLTVLRDDPEGAIRDPVVHYDAQKILFSYRPGGSEHYHLYEIGVDGSGLRQLTDGPYDDIEPTWLPNGDILFVSSRCRRWVNCWMTQVAILHRCDADGKNILPVSCNNEHDNTPWVLPNGQILYTRWEYVDRSQVCFHHLWTTNPDGTRQTVFFGNLRPGTTMIDAKPVPGSRKIVASFSPGHGRREHDGAITLVDPRKGPDDPSLARAITLEATFRDPWAFSETAFLAARGSQIRLLDDQGRSQVIYELPQEDVRAGLQCHEPRPLCARSREPLVVDSTNPSRPTGRVALLDVYRGRNMEGVQRGEIKKLLVLETLPKQANYTGGMEPLSYGGTFTLERVLGTIPVEPDGSAYAELPALRGLFFVALDDKDMSVKRMQSFMNVMPGETITCIGCHEQRTETPQFSAAASAALRRAPSKIQPIAGVPDVLDFPRDVQPVLDRHCVQCHNAHRYEGGVDLSGDRGPMFSISYYTITARSLVADGRNGMGNRPPRSIGSSASRLLRLMDGSHHGAKTSQRERAVVRLWIDTGAPYPGTYAGLGSGMIGGYARNQLDRSDVQWASTKQAVESLQRRCGSCHKGQTVLPLSPSDEVRAPPWVDLSPRDLRRRFSRHLLYNLSRPEKSQLLLAPLAEQAGGHQTCGTAVFADARDPDYQKILLMVQDAKKKLDEIKRFDMPGFRPRPEYVRELKRFGVLPADLPADAPIDVYAADRAYWKSLWHRPAE